MRPDRLFVPLLVVALALNLVPIWAVPYPPLQDLGGHIELMDVMARHGDPATIYDVTYVLPETLGPNTLSLYLARALAPLPADVTAKLMLSLYIVGLPLSIWLFCLAFRRSRWLTFMAVPALYNAVFSMGFLNYVAGLPMLFLAVALARLWAEDGKPRHAVLLALTLCVAYLAHVIVFLIALAMAAFVAALHLAYPRAAWRLFVFAPVTALLWPWASRMFLDPQATEAGRRFVDSDGALGLVFTPARDLLMQWPVWWLDTFPGRSEAVAGGGIALTLCALLGLQIAGALRRRRDGAGRERTPARAWPRAASLELITAICAVAYFVLPSHMNQMAIITERVVIITLWLLTLWPRIDMSRPLERLALVPVIASSLIYPFVVLHHYRAFDREVVGDLPAVIARAGPASKLLVMTPEREVPQINQGAHWHVAKAFHALRNGGITHDSFAAQPYTPIQYRPGATPPRPALVENNPEFEAFDTMLVYSSSMPSWLDDNPRYPLLARDGAWRLVAIGSPILRPGGVVAAGGSGGADVAWDCPADDALRGVRVDVSATGVAGVVGLCAGRDGKPSSEGRLGMATEAGAGAPVDLACTSGRFVLGLEGHADASVHQVGVRCLPAPKVALLAATSAPQAPVVTAGPKSGQPFTLSCPPGTRAIGLRGRQSGVFDSLGLNCAAPPSR